MLLVPCDNIRGKRWLIADKAIARARLVPSPSYIIIVMIYGGGLPYLQVRYHWAC